MGLSYNLDTFHSALNYFSILKQKKNLMNFNKPEQHIKSFSDPKDAFNWLEKYLDDLPASCMVYNAGVNYINNRWRAGLSFGPSQLDMFEGSND